MDSARHAGKVAIVTGAGSGIGRATAIRLSSEGARVIGCDVVEAGLAETKSAIEKAGFTADLVMADVTRQQDVERIATAAGPHVDILANVAGIMDHFLPLGEVDDATWDRVLAVNLTGVMRLSRAVLARDAVGWERLHRHRGLGGVARCWNGRGCVHHVEARRDWARQEHRLLLRTARYSIECRAARSGDHQHRHHRRPQGAVGHGACTAVDGGDAGARAAR